MVQKYINLKKSIRESDSKLLKRLPGFVINILKRIIKQTQINELIHNHKDKEGVDFSPSVLQELNIKMNIEGYENMPENGKCFFVANHPFGIVDGLMLLSLVGQKYDKLKAIGNDLFILIPPLRPVIAAVNVFGRNQRDYIIELDKVYNSNIPIAHFPAGLVSRIKNKKIMDSEWQKSFIPKAVKCQRDVVPIYFAGRNSRLFYAIFMFRKIFKIKTNIELMLLPRELFNKRNKTMKVVIGKPISYKSFDKTKTPNQWAQQIKTEVYKLNKAI
jgi:putative hemolysin